MFIALRAQSCVAARTQLGRILHKHIHNPKAPSNSPFRVPDPVYDNSIIKRREFKGKTLELASLEAAHAPDLWASSGKGNQKIGEFLPGKFPSTPLQFNYYIRDLSMVNDDPFARTVSFCIKNTVEQGMPIGIITLTNISAINKTLDVGMIWIDPELWGRHINLEAHYILMEEAFEFVRFNRVGFTVDTEDARSQHFLEGIGATREGELRSHRMGHDGKSRDAFVYSIIESEWPAVKAKMRHKIIEKLRDVTEKEKEILAEQGLLEQYEKGRERQVKEKKVTVKNTTTERTEPTKEDQEHFAELEAASAKFEEEESKKFVQRKRPPIVRKVKST